MTTDITGKTGIWKEFESNEITHSVAHHLAAINELMNQQGYARVSDVARTLEITRGSASLTLKALKERNYVLEDQNKFLRLSEEGKRIIGTVLAKRAIVRKFLRDVLQMDERQAEIDACKVEHLLSAQAGKQLLYFVRYLLSDDAKATAFLDALKFQSPHCIDVEACPICDEECLLEAEID